MAISTLLTPIKIGALPLEHRVVTAPLTRMQAGQPGMTIEGSGTHEA